MNGQLGCQPGEGIMGLLAPIAKANGMQDSWHFGPFEWSLRVSTARAVYYYYYLIQLQQDKWTNTITLFNNNKDN